MSVRTGRVVEGRYLLWNASTGMLKVKPGQEMLDKIINLRETGMTSSRSGHSQ